MQLVVSEISAFFRATTIHGFSYVGDTNNAFWVRIFWVNFWSGEIWIQCIFYFHFFHNEVVAIAIGFSVTAHMYLEALRDWTENPFITTIDRLSLTESGVPFPTVTVCPDPYKLPDRNAIVRNIADSVKFQCFKEPSNGFPACSETREVRGHPVTEAIFEYILNGVNESLIGEILKDAERDVDTYALKDANISLAEAIDIMIKNIGDEEKLGDITIRVKNEEDICGVGTTTTELRYCPLWKEMSQENAHMIRTIFPNNGGVSFGSLLKEFLPVLGNTLVPDVPGIEADCQDLGEAEERAHAYFKALSESLGLPANVSLFDVPMLYAPQSLVYDFESSEFYSYDYYPILKSQCDLLGNSSFELLPIPEWFWYSSTYWVTEDKPDLDRHFFGDDLGDRELLEALMRVMKVSHHIGHWSDYAVETGQFPFWRRNEAIFDTETENRRSRDSIFVPFSKYQLESWGESSNFEPVVTDQGICLAANALRPRQLFREGHHFVDTFERAFREDFDHNRSSVLEAMGNYYYEKLDFYVDPHTYWNEDEVSCSWLNCFRIH